MSHIPLLDQKHVILALLPFLKHLNAGTLSVVLAVVLALVSATHGTEPESRVPAAHDTTMAGAGIDNSIVVSDKLTLPGALEAICFYGQSTVSLTLLEYPKCVLRSSNSTEKGRVIGR
jgi:hypothetical protein